MSYNISGEESPFPKLEKWSQEMLAQEMLKGILEVTVAKHNVSDTTEVNETVDAFLAETQKDRREWHPKEISKVFTHICLNGVTPTPETLKNLTGLQG